MIFFTELLERGLTQRGCDLFGEELHAFPRQMIGHVAELELDQEIADFGFLDESLNSSRDGLRAADDDCLRSLKLFPVFHVAKKLSPGRVAFQIFPPCRRRNVRYARAVGELAAFAAQVAF